jgi:hypothetical protein
MTEDGFSRNINKNGKLEYTNIWNKDKDKDKRVIFVLYNFLELNKTSFYDLLTSRQSRTTDYGKRNNTPTIDYMIGQLEKACTDYINFISLERRDEHAFFILLTTMG